MTKKERAARERVVRAAIRLNSTWDGGVISNGKLPDSYATFIMSRRVCSAMRMFVKACAALAKIEKEKKRVR